MTNQIEDPWHSRPLDVHRWSDHDEVGVVVEAIADKYLPEAKKSKRGPRQTLNSIVEDGGSEPEDDIGILSA